MNRPRFLSAAVRVIVALNLGVASLAVSGCGPTSEGRPAGSIEVKNGRSTTADVDAAKAKAKAAKGKSSRRR